MKQNITESSVGSCLLMIMVDTLLLKEMPYNIALTNTN